MITTVFLWVLVVTQLMSVGLYLGRDEGSNAAWASVWALACCGVLYARLHGY